MRTEPVSAAASGVATAQRAAAAVRPGLVLLVASGATFIALLDVTVVNVAFPDLQQSFRHESIGTLSWVVSGYNVLFAALLTPAGRLADVIGRRRLFLASVLAFTAASVLSAAAPNVGTLIAARLLQGGAAAGMIPAGLGLVLAYTPAERRAAAVGVWGAAGSIAAGVGPAIGGALIDVSDWRIVFVVNVPLGLALVLAGGTGLPGDQPTDRPLPDGVGSLAIAAGLGLVVLGLTEAGDWGWGTRTLLALVAGAVLVALALLRSRRHPAPAFEVDLWGSRTFSVANATSLLFGMSMYTWLLSGPLFLTRIWGYSILTAGLAVTVGAVTSATGSVLAGKRATPAGLRTSAVVGGLLFAVGCAIFWRGAGHHPEFLTVWLPGGLIAGAGLGAVITALSTAVAGSVPPLRFAAGIGLNTTARQLGGAIGVACFAEILSARGDALAAFRDVFGFCTVTALAAAALGAGLFAGRGSR